VRAFDIRETPHVEDSIVGDITDATAVSRAAQGADAVVHLAATPDEDDFVSRLLPNNIVGVYNVLEGARRASVRRVVLASSGQVVIGHEGPWPITPEMPFAPRNWYASAKVMAEVAGQVYAYVHHLSVVVARLGWCPRDEGHAQALARDEFGKDVYLSHRDAGRFFVCAVEAQLGIPYCVTFATSRPLRQTRFDLTAAREVLGYEPQDVWPEGTEIVFDRP
jgi:nucleoside-diphosphate-sugar epimerase